MAADTFAVGAEHSTNEAGFGLIELLIAMVVLQVALLAIVGAFGSGSVALGRAAKTNTAGALADQQLELYRSMPYEAIGLDTASAPTTGTYIGDTTACPSGQTPICSNTAPRTNAGSSAWSCTAASGTTSVSTYFSANGVNPCVAHRLVNSATTPPSPDSKTYYVDTYVKWSAPIAAQRAVKQVTVVVRDGTTATELVRSVTTFDCSTGNPALAAPCL
jgi:type II secretory pathway pseudopilin PulG